MAIALKNTWEYLGKSDIYNYSFKCQLFLFGKLNSINEEALTANISLKFLVSINTDWWAYNGTRKLILTRTSPMVDIKLENNTFSDNKKWWPSGGDTVPWYGGNNWDYSNNRWSYTNVAPTNITSSSNFNTVDKFISACSDGVILNWTGDIGFDSEGNFPDVTATCELTNSAGVTSPLTINSSFNISKIDVGGKVSIKTANGWKNGQVFVKTSGGWKEAKAIYIKTSDGWKKAK